LTTLPARRQGVPVAPLAAQRAFEDAVVRGDVAFVDRVTPADFRGPNVAPAGVDPTAARPAAP